MRRRRSRPAALDHVEAQITDALQVGQELTKPSQRYPGSVRRALRLAYAIHFRVLMEFLHDGRPPGQIKKEDIHLPTLLDGEVWSRPR